MNTIDDFKKGILMLDDGTVYSGYVLKNCNKNYFGEICFNTATTGYQEIATDPSYCKQIIVYTFPHIGNVGCNNEDIESVKYLLQSKHNILLVVRNLPTNQSNYRAAESLVNFCLKNNIIIFADVDTRAITKKITSKSLKLGNAAISPIDLSSKDSVNEVKDLFALLKQQPDMNGAEIAGIVYEKKQEFFENGKFTNSITKRDWARNLAVIDFGIKENILKLLEQSDFDIHIFPHDVDYKTIQNFDAFFLSNGPGDPRATYFLCKDTVRSILDSKKPVFGICLGHQILAIASGLRIEKMPQGHRGANQPVKNLQTNLVEITSQNHGFVVCDSDIPSDIIITHRSLFDGVIQGFSNKSGTVIGIQYHPESSPGPHDSRYLFKKFRSVVV